MPAQKPPSAIIDRLLDDELAALQEKKQRLDESHRPTTLREKTGHDKRGVAVVAAGQRPSPQSREAELQRQEAVKKIDASARRLRQVQKYFREDPELMHLVDASIAKNTRMMQRRQTIISTSIAVISLLVGWLLSAVSPVSAMHLFGR